MLYAFEVLEEIPEIKSKTTTLTTGALDWLQTITNADGGIPFVLPTAKGWPHAPWWTPTDDPPSSLLMTAGTVAAAYRLKLDGHPWLEPATNYVWNALADLKLSDAYSFRYAVNFLDAVPDRDRADAELATLRERMPSDGILKVEVGVEGEVLSAIEVDPVPTTPARPLPRRAHRGPARRARRRPTRRRRLGLHLGRLEPRRRLRAARDGDAQRAHHPARLRPGGDLTRSGSSRGEPTPKRPGPRGVTRDAAL